MVIGFGIVVIVDSVFIVYGFCFGVFCVILRIFIRVFGDVIVVRRLRRKRGGCLRRRSRGVVYGLRRVVSIDYFLFSMYRELVIFFCIGCLKFCNYFKR